MKVYFFMLYLMATIKSQAQAKNNQAFCLKKSSSVVENNSSFNVFAYVSYPKNYLNACITLNYDESMGRFKYLYLINGTELKLNLDSTYSDNDFKWFVQDHWVMVHYCGKEHNWAMFGSARRHVTMKELDDQVQIFNTFYTFVYDYFQYSFINFTCDFHDFSRSDWINYITFEPVVIFIVICICICCKVLDKPMAI